MAEENETPEVAPEGAGEDTGKKKKKMIMFGGIGALVLALGAGAFLFMGSSDEKKMSAKDAQSEEGSENAEEGAEPTDGEKPSEDGEKKEGEGDKKEGEGAEKVPDKDEDEETVEIDFGQTFSMKTFHLNLGNPLENRFMRMDVSLEYKGGDAHKKEIEARTPQLRDAIVNVASRKTREFLLGPDGKDQLRLEMLNRINQYMDRKIETVFITDILIE